MYMNQLKYIKIMGYIPFNDIDELKHANITYDKITSL